MTAPEIIAIGVDDRWPAGRPASQRSAFYQTADGSQIAFALEATERARRRSTGTVERLRREGRDNSTIVGLTMKQIKRDTASDTKAAAGYMKKAGTGKGGA